MKTGYRMAEDDEIDILEDFSVDSSVSHSENFDISAALGSQNSDLLTCDYTTPLYLDNSGTHTLWFSNGNSCFSSELQTENLTEAQQEKVNSNKETPSTSSSNVISDSSGWTVKEKGLLCNGVQIFGSNNVCLSKFIGSKSADEVKFYLRHFYRDHLKSMSDSSVAETNTSETPTNMEETIATVSTAKPTVPVSPKRVTERKGRKDINKKVFLKQSRNLLKPKHNFNITNIRNNEKGKFNVNKKIRLQESKSPNVSTTTKSVILHSEEVVIIKKLSPGDADVEVEVDIDIESLSEDECVQTNGSSNKQTNTSLVSSTKQTWTPATNSSQTPSNDVPLKRNSLHSSRQLKKKFLNNGEGGKTLTHGVDGEVIHTTIVDESSAKKTATGPKKIPIRLIYCRPFDNHLPQPFKVAIHISALILMDLHAHTCYTEVMGLVGGFLNHKTGQLTISVYQPCRNTSDSATHCDMCPITQAKAADNIHSKGLEVVGWFHSHPTFSPEPSQQDIDTQVSLQNWLGGKNKPCLGIILTPYGGASAPSNIRCLIAHKNENYDDQFVPYKFKTKIIAEGLDVNDFLDKARRVIEFDGKTSADNVFSKDYFLDRNLKHREKFLNSAKMDLIKCEDINKMTCDAITKGLSNVVGNY